MITCEVRSKDYIQGVFTISKQNICAEVVLTAGFLKLVPINPDARFLKAHTAILANLKIMAQIHLGKMKTTNHDAILFEYFALHGWAVTV